MDRIHSGYNIKVALVSFAAFGLFTFTLLAKLSNKTTMEAAIEQEAKVVFEMDSSKVARFPQRDLVALSVAIGFKDYQGAAKILRKLKGN